MLQSADNMSKRQQLTVGSDLARRVKKLAKYSGMTIKSWTSRALDSAVQAGEQQMKSETKK